MDKTLQRSGFGSVESMRAKKWHSCELPFEETNFITGFGTSDKRFHFKADWDLVGPNSDGMPEYPDHWNVVDRTSETYPFRLVAAPARQFLNTTFTETPTGRKMEKEPGVLMHPQDIQRLGLVEGEVVKVISAQGEILVRAKLFEGLQQGTVVVESIWQNADFAGGAGVNTLVSSEPAQPNGGAVFHDTAVSIVAI